MRWGLLVAMFALVFAIVGLYVLSSRVDLSAIQQPGHTGEYLRTKLTRAVIRRRAAREEIPPPLPDRQTSMSIAAGKNLYDMDCASCHGSDEKGPTPVGRGMLPRSVAFDVGEEDGKSPAAMLDALKKGRIDVLITWQPAIGAFLRAYPEFVVVVVPNERALGTPEQYSFPMSMGVRIGDDGLKKRLDEVIGKHQAELTSILTASGVKSFSPP